jgi:hypothetical protein
MRFDRIGSRKHRDASLLTLSILKPFQEAESIESHGGYLRIYISYF